MQGGKKSKHRNEMSIRESPRRKMTSLEEKSKNVDIVQSRRKLYSPKQPKNPHLSDRKILDPEILKSRNRNSERRPLLNESKKLLKSKLDDTTDSPRISDFDPEMATDKHLESDEHINDASSQQVNDSDFEIDQDDEDPNDLRDPRKSSVNSVKKPFSFSGLEEKLLADVDRRKSQLLEQKLEQSPSKELKRSHSSRTEEGKKLRKEWKNRIRPQDETDDEVTSRKISRVFSSKSYEIADKHATDNKLGRHRTRTGLKNEPLKKSEKLTSSRMSTRRKTDELDTSKAISTNFTDEFNNKSNPTPDGIPEPQNLYEESVGLQYNDEQTAHFEQETEQANVTTKEMEDETLEMVAEMDQPHLVDAHDALRKDESERPVAMKICRRLTSLISENAVGKLQRTIESQVIGIQLMNTNGTFVKHLKMVEVENKCKGSLNDGYREQEESESVATIMANLSHPVDTITDTQINGNEPQKANENDERNMKLEISIIPPNSHEQISSDAPLISSEGRKNVRSEQNSMTIDHFGWRNQEYSFGFIESQKIKNCEKISINGPQNLNKQSEPQRSAVNNETILSDKPSPLSQIDTVRVVPDAHLSGIDKLQLKKTPGAADTGNNPSLLAITYELINNVNRTEPRTSMVFLEKIGKPVPFDVIEAQVDINLGKSNAVLSNGNEVFQPPGVSRTLINSDERVTSSKADDIPGKVTIAVTDQVKLFQPQRPDVGSEREKLISIITKQGPKSEIVEIDQAMLTNPNKPEEVAGNKLLDSKEYQIAMEGFAEFDKPSAKMGSLAFSAEIIKLNEPIQFSLLHDHQPVILVEAMAEENPNEPFCVNHCVPYKSSEPKEVSFLPSSSITSRSTLSSPCSNHLSSESDRALQSKKHSKNLMLSLITEMKAQNLEEKLQEDPHDVSSSKDKSKVGEGTLLKLQSETSREAKFYETFKAATVGSTEKIQEEREEVKSLNELENMCIGKEGTAEDHKKKATQVLRILVPNCSDIVSVRAYQDIPASNLCEPIRQMTTFAVEVGKGGQECEKLIYLALPDPVIIVQTIYSRPVAEISLRITHTSERISMKLNEAAEVRSDSQVAFVQAIRLNNPECAKLEIHKSETPTLKKCNSNSSFRQESLRSTEIDTDFDWSWPTSVTGVTPLEQMLEMAVL